MSERQGSRDGARPGADPLYAGWVGCWSSLLFFSAISGFPPSAKTSTFNFQFDQNRGPAWKPAKADVASSLNIVIYERPLNICDSNIYMLFAGLGSVRMVKNCDRGLENAARGRRPRAAFSSPRSQFSPYGPTLSRQITCFFFFFPAVNWFYRLQMR